MDDMPAWAMEDSDSDGDGDNQDSSSGKKKGGKKKGGGDIEMQKQGDDNNKYMADFFKHVEDINADIKAVSQASKDITAINEKSMRATTTAEEKSLSKKLGPLISDTNKRAKNTKQLLGILKEETDKLKAEGKLNASDVRYVSTRIVICCYMISMIADAYFIIFYKKFSFEARNSPIHNGMLEIAPNQL